MRSLLAVPVVLGALLAAPSVSATSGGRPVALVTAETTNTVFAVSLGPHGGHVLRRVHLDDPLMVAAAPLGPAVVVNPSGIVTLLAWHTLRPIKVFHSFRSPKVAAVTPDGRFAYVTDEGTGDLSVIDLAARRIVGRVFVGLEAHHLGISPDGRRIWVALGETATTVVRLDASNPRKPRVIGRLHPRDGAHDVSFAPDGRTIWVTSPSRPYVSGYSVGGRLLWTAGAGRRPGTWPSPAAARSCRAATARCCGRSPGAARPLPRAAPPRRTAPSTWSRTAASSSPRRSSPAR